MKISEYVSIGHPDKVADYISEYNTPFEKIASFGKMSLLNNSKDKKPLISENLYYHKGNNGEEIGKVKFTQG